MKMLKCTGHILSILTILSIPFSFAISGFIGETAIFGVAGIVRYSWIMWLFIPIGVTSLLIGRALKHRNQKYKKNDIVAFICIALLLIFGSYRFVFDNFSYDTNEISIVEQATHVNLPSNVKVATNHLEQYTLSYVKIVDQEEKKYFETSVAEHDLWTSELSSALKGILPLDIQMEIDNFDYFLFYNCSNNEYNIYPSNGKHECIFIAYDCEMSRLIIINQ